MSMGCEEWERILNAVNDDKDLKQDNVVDKIKKEFEAETKNGWDVFRFKSSAYEKWKEASFDVNYLFEVSIYLQFYKLTLLHMAAMGDYMNIVNALIKKRGEG